MTHVRPTPRHAVAVEASAGGPIALLGAAPVPLPLSTIGASYGVIDGLDVQAHVHLTTLFAFGVAGGDIGATWMPLTQRQARPALAFTGRLYAFTDFHSGTFGYAELSGTVSWLLATRWLTYGTIGGLVEFNDGYVHWAPGVGEQVQLGRAWLGLEVRWYDAGYETRLSSANWLSPGGLGAIGVVLGGGYRFGG
jgi:hypothetical protein